MKYLEDNKTELKRELIDDVKKEIVAFLNTKAGRYMSVLMTMELCFCHFLIKAKMNCL